MVAEKAYIHPAAATLGATYRNFQKSGLAVISCVKFSRGFTFEGFLAMNSFDLSSALDPPSVLPHCPSAHTPANTHRKTHMHTHEHNH